LSTPFCDGIITSSIPHSEFAAPGPQQPSSVSRIIDTNFFCGEGMAKIDFGVKLEVQSLFHMDPKAIGM
jgi:hypothetical protein